MWGMGLDLPGAVYLEVAGLPVNNPNSQGRLTSKREMGEIS